MHKPVQRAHPPRSIHVTEENAQMELRTPKGTVHIQLHNPVDNDVRFTYFMHYSFNLFYFQYFLQKCQEKKMKQFPCQGKCPLHLFFKIRYHLQKIPAYFT